MPTRYHYPVELTPEEDGGLIVSFPDLPEALTCGADRLEALAEAADCLEEALAGRITERMEIPTPRPLAVEQQWRQARQSRPRPPSGPKCARQE